MLADPAINRRFVATVSHVEITQRPASTEKRPYCR